MRILASGIMAAGLLFWAGGVATADESIEVATTAELEAAASDPANAGRTIRVAPGVYTPTVPLTLPPGAALVGLQELAADADGHPATVLANETVLDFSGVAGFGPRVVVSAGGKVSGLTIATTAQNVVPTIGVAVITDGDVRNSLISGFTVGLLGDVAAGEDHARFKVSGNLVANNVIGGWFWSRVDGASGDLDLQRNAFRANFSRALLFSGGRDGSDNDWTVTAVRNVYEAPPFPVPQSIGAFIIAGEEDPLLPEPFRIGGNRNTTRYRSTQETYRGYEVGLWVTGAWRDDPTTPDGVTAESNDNAIDYRSTGATFEAAENTLYDIVATGAVTFGTASLPGDDLGYSTVPAGSDNHVSAQFSATALDAGVRVEDSLPTGPNTADVRFVSNVP